jgi:pyruvate ferredoxin oxidoreductase gamma subunit
MMQLRFHGRGGQGAVTSAEIVATAAIGAGKFAQAFPSFGPERRGAPVVAFARISEEKIMDRTAVLRPDAVIVLDPALIKMVKVADGLGEDGFLIVNTSKDKDEVILHTGFKGNLALVNANKISIEVIGRAITNMVMLGALVKATGLVKPEQIEGIILERFGGLLGQKNVEAMKRAAKETVIIKGNAKEKP